MNKATEHARDLKDQRQKNKWLVRRLSEMEKEIEQLQRDNELLKGEIHNLTERVAQMEGG
jgi:FtsZ-binding cell division protein ZapB